MKKAISTLLGIMFLILMLVPNSVLASNEMVGKVLSINYGLTGAPKSYYENNNTNPNRSTVDFKIQVKDGNRPVVGKEFFWKINHPGSSTLVPDSGYAITNNNGYLKLASTDEESGEVRITPGEYDPWSLTPSFYGLDNGNSNVWTFSIGGVDDDNKFTDEMSYIITQSDIPLFNPIVKTVDGNFSESTNLYFVSSYNKVSEPGDSEPVPESVKQDIKFSARLLDTNWLPVSGDVSGTVKITGTELNSSKDQSFYFDSESQKEKEITFTSLENLASQTVKVNLTKSNTNYCFDIKLTPNNSEQYRDDNYLVRAFVSTNGSKKIQSVNFLNKQKYGNDSLDSCDTANFNIYKLSAEPETTDVKNVVVSPSSLTMEAGASQTISATVLPETAANKTITWSSSDSTVAEYNEKTGRILAYREGTAKIFATAENNKVGYCEVTVFEPFKAEKSEVKHIALNKSNINLKVGEYYSLIATTDYTGTQAPTITYNIPSGERAIADIDSSGKVIAKGAGTTTVTVTAKIGSSEKTATCTINVEKVDNEVKVTEVKLDKTKVELTIGNTVNLAATVLPEDATNKNIKWYSGDEEVATIENGKVTAVGEGTTKIEAQSFANSSIKAECEVTVKGVKKDVKVTGITVNPATLTIKEGENAMLSETVLPVDATNKNVIWDSSNDKVVTVSSNGRVVGVAEGTAKVIVKTVDGSKTASCDVTVTESSIKTKPGNVIVPGSGNPSLDRTPGIYPPSSSTPTPDLNTNTGNNGANVENPVTNTDKDEKPDDSVEQDKTDKPASSPEQNEEAPTITPTPQPKPTPSEPNNNTDNTVTPDTNSNTGTYAPAQIYRLYLAANNEHLYTSDANEAQALIAQGWSNENVGWNSPSTGDPVYRLYSPVTNEHHYTKDTNEVNVLSQNGWSVDNGGQPLFFSGGEKPIYRLYHEGTQRHHLTTDENEFNTLGAKGWNKEGVALYSLS